MHLVGLAAEALGEDSYLADGHSTCHRKSFEFTAEEFEECVDAHRRSHSTCGISPIPAFFGSGFLRKRKYQKRRYTRSIDALWVFAFNWDMTRCYECNGIIARAESECYICGEPVPGAKKRSWLQNKKKEPKPAPPVTPLSNLLFMASLVLTAVSFLSGQKMSIGLSATLSLTLFVARLLADRLAVRQQLALRPVTVPRLDN